MEYLDLSRMREVGYTSTKLLSVHVRDAFRISTRSLSSGLCFQACIRCSSAGAGGNQTLLYYCRRLYSS